MKILVINWQDWLNPLSGGAEVHLRETFRRIAAAGHRVTLFCCRFDGAPKEEVVDGITIIRRGSRNVFNFLVPFYYLLRFRHEEFDVVVDDINKIPFYTPVFVHRPLVALSHHFFGSSIFVEAGPISGSYVWIGEKLVDCIYKQTRFLVVSDSTLNEFVERGFRRDHFTLAMNAIDHDLLHPTGVPKTEHPSVGYFGRLKKYKSVDHVVRAFAKVRNRIPSAELVIIGRGDFQPELEQLATDLGIADCVRFMGFVSEEEKHRLLQQLWVVVNPSMKEGWGIVNVEANACGTPAIAADSPGLRDSVRDGVTGDLYPYGDVGALAARIERILLDNELRASYGAASLEFAKSLTWEATATATLRVLAQATGQEEPELTSRQG